MARDPRCDIPLEPIRIGPVMKKSRFTESRIMGELRPAEGGMPVPALCREHGISSALR